jgi:predicted enzyme related to lactoylglutathione lyase
VIRSVAKVVVPVDDQERAEEFWTGRAGFGVEFPTAPVQMHLGWWAMFTDPDGTRYALGQW